MPVRFLIIQTDESSYEKCSEALVAVGLVRNVDFLITRGPSKFLEENVVADADQVLITGTFHSNEMAASNYARYMQRRNRNLKIWFLSSVEPQEKYDKTLLKKGATPFKGLAHALLAQLGR